uniref:Nuclear shell protein n=1 Tax=Pseudomonas phage RVTF4 TaxID=3236931 RepID=A0AB39CCQ2_9VIRU
MSVNKGNTQKPAAAQTQFVQPAVQQAAPQQTAQVTAPMQPTPIAAGMSQLNRSFARSGRADGNDARLTKALVAFTEAGKEAIEQQDLADNFHIFRFDRTAHQVAMGSILVLKLVDNRGTPAILVKALPILDNSVPIKPKTFQIQNGYNAFDKYEVKPDASDIFTPLYWSRIVSYVRTATGHPNAAVYNAGPQEIHSEFDFEDRGLVRNLLIKAVNSVEDAMGRLSDERPFSLATDMQSQDEILAATIDYTGIQAETNTGLPIRSDIAVSLQRRKKQHQGQQVQENEYYDADSQLNTVHMFVDLEYSPQQVQQIYGMPASAPVPPFVPALVVTAVKQANWIMANTPEMYFFSLGNAYRATNGQGWAKVFLPTIGRTKDPRDIGATGYLSPKGLKVETKSDTFTEADFAGLMFSQVQQNPVIMLDLDRMGDNSYVETMILDSLGGPNAEAAKAGIIRILCNLYGRENFLSVFDAATDWLFQPYGTDFNLGHYPGEDGGMRDRRDLDTLAALNFSEGLQSEFMDWYGAKCNPNVHPEVRRKKSEVYDKQYLGNVTYTGRVTRVLVNPKLIAAMDAASSKAGLQITMDNVGSIFGAQRFQGNMNLQGMNVMGVANVQNYLSNQVQYAPSIQGGTGMQY